MHEYALVDMIIGKIEEEARARNAPAVQRVRVRVRRSAEVDESLVATAFEAMRVGTVCRNAELVLVRGNDDWRCVACGQSLPPEGALTCPKCDWVVHHVSEADLVLEHVDTDEPNA